MMHIKPSNMGVSLVVILPLLWKGITCPPGYSIQVSSSVRVQEGLCVSIPCNFTADGRNTFSNSTGYWHWIQLFSFSGYIVATNYKSRDVKKTNFHLMGNPDTGDCTLTITDAGREDEGEYYYRFVESIYSPVKYNYNREMTTTITVTGEERPASPQVDIDQTETLTLVCRADGNPPVTVVWMRGEDDTDSSMSDNGLSAVINVTSSMSDVYRCLAWNALGLRERRIQIGTKHDGCMDSTIIIGMVVGDIVLLILIIVGSYFFLKRRMEKRLLEKRSPDPGTQETIESTYQELKGQKDNVYDDFNVQ